MTTATVAAGSPRQSKLGAVIRVTSGNFLEQFDFFLAGFYATYIAKTFVPMQSQFASLMWTFGAFSLATALFGGMTALVSTFLIEKTGDKAAPAYWMTFAAVCSLVATLLLLRRSRRGAAT